MTIQNRPQSSLWLRNVVALFVLATCFRVWLGPITIVDSARAQIPNAGAQRKQVVDLARQTNQLLADIKTLLTTHTFNVKIKGADNPRADN